MINNLGTMLDVQMISPSLLPAMQHELGVGSLEATSVIFTYTRTGTNELFLGPDLLQ